MQSGIYHVSFRSSADAGEGLVVIKDGAVNGGDQSYVYTGHLNGANGQLSGQLHIQQWRAGNPSVFGAISQFDLTLSGTSDDQAGTFTVDGHVTANPALRIGINGRRVAAAT